MESTWRIITFNIRRSECDDGNNRWEFRAPHTIKWIQEQQPHIVSFQEAMPDVVAALKENLPDYDWAGCGRCAALDDEHCRIGWRNEEFTAIRQETFWLSDTPTIPASKFEGNNTFWPRVGTMVELYSKENGHRFRVYNTHLDNACLLSQKEGTRVLMEHITQDYQADPLPFLLMGDFNVTPDSAVLQQVKTSSPVTLKDFSATDDLPFDYTYHEYGRLEHACKIDYLFGNSQWHLKEHHLGTQCENGVYLSDHFPIIAELSLQA